MTEDPRLRAARYRLDRLAAEADDAAAGTDAAAEAEASSQDVQARASAAERSRAASAVQRAAYVETTIQQAMRRGDFDDLPGAGKPIPGLGEAHDPDWWIRRKIQTERLTGLGPPALMLRVEAADLADRLDELAGESDVREALEDFNRRVIEARRQLLGGPPVVTPTRDIEADVAAWLTRRDARIAAAAQTTPVSDSRRSLRERLRGILRRAGRGGPSAR